MIFRGVTHRNIHCTPCMRENTGSLMMIEKKLHFESDKILKKRSFRCSLEDMVR